MMIKRGFKSAYAFQSLMLNQNSVEEFVEYNKMEKIKEMVDSLRNFKNKGVKEAHFNVHELYELMTEFYTIKKDLETYKEALRKETNKKLEEELDKMQAMAVHYAIELMGANGKELIQLRKDNQILLDAMEGYEKDKDE